MSEFSDLEDTVCIGKTSDLVFLSTNQEPANNTFLHKLGTTLTI